jgi:NADH dehydrogenase [ubiquinone] 1 alpha subcomplex assembly factor 5
MSVEKALFRDEELDSSLAVKPIRIIGDEEYVPFQNESLDLVISNMSLHWVNDLPGTFAQVRRSLKPDGMFLGALLGENTLMELRYIIFDWHSIEDSIGD